MGLFGFDSNKVEQKSENYQVALQGGSGSGKTVGAGANHSGAFQVLDAGASAIGSIKKSGNTKTVIKGLTVNQAVDPGLLQFAQAAINSMSVMSNTLIDKASSLNIASLENHQYGEDTPAIIPNQVGSGNGQPTDNGNGSTASLTGNTIQLKPVLIAAVAVVAAVAIAYYSARLFK